MSLFIRLLSLGCSASLPAHIRRLRKSGAGLAWFGLALVFQVALAGAAQAQELTTLYNFGTASTDGSASRAGLMQASDGISMAARTELSIR